MLPWDSERFGFGVARVRASVMPESLETVVDRMRGGGVILAYYGIADGRQAIADQYAARVGATLVDTRIVFRKQLESRDAGESPQNGAASALRMRQGGEAVEIKIFSGARGRRRFD